MFLTGKARCGNLPADNLLAGQPHDFGLGRVPLDAIGRPAICRQLVNPRQALPVVPDDCGRAAALLHR
jgi:hypothetical protein